MAHYTDWPEYPTNLLDLTDFPTQTDDVDDVSAWLINALAHEMIAVQKELGTQPKAGFADVDARLDAMLPHYNDRGDPSAYDFTLANLTTDGTWRDLDLSAIVPAGTKAVLLLINVWDDKSNTDLYLKEKGNSNAYNASRINTQIANVSILNDAIVACDDNRKIQYYAENTTWTALNLVVRGWFK